jgi:hypothetical protein
MKMGSHCGPIFMGEWVSDITQNKELKNIITYKHSS